MATIVVVDDEQDIRELVAVTLEGYGHEVLTASDGPEGLDLITNRGPALVVLDVMMPMMDGWAVLREMRRIGLKARTRVIVLSARTREGDLLTGWQLGIDDYVTKPFEPAELGRRVNEVLLATSEELGRHRNAEIEKAAVLARLENLFDV